MPTCECNRWQLSNDTDPLMQLWDFRLLFSQSEDSDLTKFLIQEGPHLFMTLLEVFFRPDCTWCRQHRFFSTPTISTVVDLGGLCSLREERGDGRLVTLVLYPSPVTIRFFFFSVVIYESGSFSLGKIIIQSRTNLNQTTLHSSGISHLRVRVRGAASKKLF